MKIALSRFAHTPPNGQNTPDFIRRTNHVMMVGLEPCAEEEKEKIRAQYDVFSAKP